MIVFKAEILKFGQMGEKTGWTYIEIPPEVSAELSPGNKKSFRIKGTIDLYTIKQTALIPMGEGNFILPINATMRKAIKKEKGTIIKLAIELDLAPLQMSEELMECLHEEPEAKEFFESLPPSHQHYYSKWIESARTVETKTKRMAMALNAFAKKQGYAEMMRANKASKLQ